MPEGLAELSSPRIRKMFRANLGVLVLWMAIAGPITAMASGVAIVCPATEVPAAGTFQADVSIDTGAKVLGAYTLAINYDESILTIEAIDGGTTAGFTEAPVTNPADFATGRTRLSAFNSTSTTAPIGIVHVATIVFNVEGVPGSGSTLVPEIITLVDSGGPNPNDPPTNICSPSPAECQLLQCQVSVGSIGSTSTPTRTPTPTPTPTPTGAPSPSAKQVTTCKRAIAKEAAVFVQTTIAQFAKCEVSKVKGKLPMETDCRVEKKTAAALDVARVKLDTAIGKKCGGTDKLCGSNLAQEVGGAALGWPMSCPSLKYGSCAGAIGRADCAGIATCLACLDAAAIEHLRAITFNDLNHTDPKLKVEKPLNTCQQAVGTTTATFMRSKANARQKCWDARLQGKHADDCTNPVIAADGRVEDAITKAEDKRKAVLCKACGGADKACDGIADFTRDQIGFSSTCEVATVPFGGPACGGPISSVGDVAECLGCVAEFAIDCVDRVAVPDIATIPSECVP